MALATNSNPVSSPTVSPAAQMHLACYLFRLTPEEALRGFTVNGARALGLADSAGPHRRGPRRRPRGVGHRRSARHRLCDRRRAVPRRVKNGVVVHEAAVAGVRAGMSARDKLLGWLDAERDRQVDFLQRFTRIDTCQPAGRHAAGRRLLPRLPRRARASPIAPRRRRRPMPNLIASFDGGAGARPASGAERPSRRVPDRRPRRLDSAIRCPARSSTAASRPRHGRHEMRHHGAAVRPFAYLHRLRARAARPGHAHRGVRRGDRRQMGRRLAGRELRRRSAGRLRAEHRAERACTPCGSARSACSGCAFTST